MSQNLTLTHSFKQSLLWIVVTCIIALVVLFLAITSSPPNHMPVRIIEYDEKAALTHYKKNYIFDFTSFMRSFDQNRNGKIEISEWTIELHAGVASILNPAQSLQALDRLTKEAALQEIETRYESILDQIRTAQDPREQYWKFDIQAQYLARKHQLIPESILGIIDNKGKRLIHGAEDLPPLLSWDKINPQLFEVPWPPGNVAISQLKNQIRVFLTPFPDANFSDIQIYELQLENEQLTPYPPNQLDLQRKLRNSLGIEAHQGRLYIVDHGAYGVHSGRLVVVDLQTDQLLLNYVFPIKLGQMPNDFAFVDKRDSTHVFISDTAPGRSPLGFFNAKSGIIEIVLQFDQNGAHVIDHHRFLDGDPMVEDGGYHLYPSRDDPARTWLGELAWGGVDGIAAFNNELYFRRMQMPEIQVVNAFDIHSEKARVLDKFPIIDGFHIDDTGILWFGDVEHAGLFAYDLKTKVMVKILQDHRFHWIDEVNVLHDKAYITCSHLHKYLWALIPWQRRMAIEKNAPFYFFIFDITPVRNLVQQLRSELSLVF